MDEIGKMSREYELLFWVGKHLRKAQNHGHFSYVSSKIKYSFGRYLIKQQENILLVATTFVMILRKYRLVVCFEKYNLP